MHQTRKMTRWAWQAVESLSGAVTGRAAAGIPADPEEGRNSVLDTRTQALVQRAGGGRREPAGITAQRWACGWWLESQLWKQPPYSCAGGCRLGGWHVGSRLSRRSSGAWMSAPLLVSFAASAQHGLPVRHPICFGLWRGALCNHVNVPGGRGTVTSPGFSVVLSPTKSS